ncbi:MAG: FecR domain-containing protein [Tannerella sp.]|jgi:ferric-dicitrate binding protein FerR (iron transport regulator)|nr:FecR domain-containing protein [Tannerella sp.]
MDENRITKIIKKYLSGRHSAQTEEIVQKWIIKDTDAEEKEQASLEYWNELNVKTDQNIYPALQKVNRRIGHSGENERIPADHKKTGFLEKQERQASRILPYKKIIRIAAVLIPLFIFTGGYFLYHSGSSSMIEISTAYGNERHILLPDSSEIWLNAGSTVKYPRKFKEEQRLIFLDGEAYFSVRKNTGKPFIVETKQLTVKVLGTQFNVKAYTGDEKVITTLTSGKVQVTTGTSGSQVLKPNEQLIYNKKTNNFSITEIPADETSGWLAGQLIFSNTSFDEIIQTLERRFDVTIENKTVIYSNKQYTIKFLKNENLTEILDILREMIGISYQQTGNNIILTD